MAFRATHPRALILGASALSIVAVFSTSALTQTADGEAVRASEQKKPKQAKRKPAEQQAQSPFPAPVMNARAQIGRAPVQSLDAITAVATKTDEKAIDS